MLTDNVVSLYRAASPDSINEGLAWYDEANEFARALDGMRFHRAAGIMAALSPLSAWANNKRKTAKFYAQNGVVQWDGTKNGIGLSNNVRKAERIWSGEDALDVLVADKTRNFFLSIVEPNSLSLVPVIDRHAFDIANGYVGNDSSRQSLGRKAVYEQYAEAYREASRRVGVPVHHLQAITWVEWRKRLSHLGQWAG
jgi:hypothetical protein